MDPAEKARLEQEQIKALTGVPLPHDKLSFAVAVCAPSSAILNYKFKVKVTPGSEKRGKAAKSAMHLFGQQGNLSKQEAGILKAMTDNELVQAIVSDAKVS